MPQISIIVPVYNPGKEKLTRCLNSIAEQTFADYEVILVDDGSCDETPELCDEFCRTDTRFTVIHQENKGVSCARNRGLAESCGEYICFIDCDDYVKNEYLEALFFLMNQEADTELSICGVELLTESGLQLFSQERKEAAMAVNVNDTSLIAELLDNRYYNYVYAKLYSGEIIRNFNIRFDERYSLGEDTLFVMAYLQHVNRMMISGHVLYTYIKYGSGTLSSARHADKYIKLMEINRCIEDTLIRKNREINAALLLRKIDDRQLLCAEWAIEGAEQQETWVNQVAATQSVLYSINLQRSVERNGKEILGIQKAVLYKMRAARLILLLRKIDRMWRQYSGIIRRKIRAVFGPTQQ